MVSFKTPISRTEQTWQYSLEVWNDRWILKFTASLLACSNVLLPCQSNSAWEQAWVVCEPF
jgi:hypothetical protein